MKLIPALVAALALVGLGACGVPASTPSYQSYSSSASATPTADQFAADYERALREAQSAISAQPTLPPGTFTDGTYVVGEEIQPGTYKTAGPDANSMVPLCYWARLSNLEGDLDSIIANDNIQGQTTIVIKASDKAIRFDNGCTWTKK